MAITQYRTNSASGYRYSAPSSTEVSSLIPVGQDYMAIKTKDDGWTLLVGKFENGHFTGKGQDISTSGFGQVDSYSNESITIYNPYYVYSNLDGYRDVQNIRATNVLGNFSGFLWVLIIMYIVLGGAFKCVKSLFVRSRSR